MSSRKLYLRTRRKQEQNLPKPEPVTPRYLDGGYGWVIVMSSFICNMVVDGIANSYGVFITSFTDSFGEDKGKVAFANSVNVGMHLLIGPLVGALCKRYSCRAVCIAGGILSSTAFALSLIATNTLVLTLLYGLMGGTGFGLIYISTVILVSYYFELKRSLAVGISLCGSGFGTCVFPPLSQYLLSKFNWRGTHLIFTGFLLVCILFSLLLLPLEYFESKIPKATSRMKLVQIKKVDTLAPVLEDSIEVDDNPKDQRKECKSEAVSIEVEANQVSLLKETSVVTNNSKTSDIAIAPTSVTPSDIHPTPIIVHEFVARSHLPKKDILKILLFTRIVMKKDCMGSKLPLFSRRILDDMKSLQDMSESETLDYEVLDFHEIKKSKSEDLTLLQHYLSHVEMNIGESLPSDLNHYAYIVNDVGVSMSKQVTPAITILPAQHYATQDFCTDAVSTRNVHSLPVLDQINENDPFLRETQSNKALTDGINDQLSEHVRFVSDLFVNSVPNNHMSWSKDDFEPANSENSFRTNELEREEKSQVIPNGETLKPVEHYVKRGDSWWNSSSSVRKDMYFTESISNLKEYREEADDEQYRKRHTVQVSLLQEMWDRDLLSNVLFIIFILHNMFLLAGYYIPYVYLVDTAKAHGVNDRNASFLMSVIGISNMIGRIFFGYLDNLKLMDSLLLNNLSLIVSGLSVLCFPYCAEFYQYVVTSVVVGFSQACVVCITTTLLVQLFTLDKLTNSFGMVQMFRGVAIMFGSPCAGYIYKLTNSYHWIYWVSAGFYGLSVVFGFLLQCARKPDTTHYQNVASKANEYDVVNNEDPSVMEMVTTL